MNKTNRFVDGFIMNLYEKLQHLKYMHIEAKVSLIPLKIDFNGNILKHQNFKATVVKELAKRHFDFCFVCNKRETALLPHRIVYKCLRGDYHIINVVMLCKSCHSKEFEYWSKSKNIFFPIDYNNKWSEVIDKSFSIFKQFLLSHC